MRDRICFLATIACLCGTVLNGRAVATEPDDIWDYGQRCAEQIGVELPPIDCLADNSTELPVTRNGVTITTQSEDCDKPALLEPAKACVAGSRLQRITQQAVGPNGEQQTVTTMVLCRRTHAYPPVRVPGTNRFVPDNRFNDIGVIQYNEDTHKTCYYYTLSDAGIPAGRDFTRTGAERNETLIPPPFSSHNDDGYAAQDARDFWAQPSLVRSTHCTRCHNNGPWIHDPYVLQADDEFHAHRQVNGHRIDNRVPRNERGVHPTQVGDMFASWNTTDRPYQIRIDENAFAAALRPEVRTAYQTALNNGQAAPLNECTSCHDLGANRDPNDRNNGTCGFVRAFATGQNPGTSEYDQRSFRLSRWARQFPHAAWMPPDHGFDNQSQFEQYYRYALGAIEACCQNPELAASVNGHDTPLCYDPATEGRSPGGPTTAHRQRGGAHSG